MVKKGKMLVDKAIKSAETMLPPEMKDDFINGIHACKGRITAFNIFWL